MATVNFFIQEGELPQQTDSFGPVSSTQYKVTSLFNGSNSGSNPMAFAVRSGRVFIVDQTGQPDRVNLFLRPDENTPGLPPVKYFIYRGLLKEDFLDKSNNYKTMKSAGNDSELMTTIRGAIGTDQDRLKALELYSSQITSFIDSLFIKEDNQFAPVKKGDSLGRFDLSSDYGFEIMLDEFWFNPTMDVARADVNIIQIPATAGDDEVARLNTLCYIDPAAYFGCFSHGDFSVGTNNSNSPFARSKEDIYELVKKFTTKNNVYLDIRGTQGHPVDWFTADPQDIQISLDGTSALTNASPVSYRGSNTFPLHIIPSGFFKFTNPGWPEIF